jgi:hypothetical protein
MLLRNFWRSAEVIGFDIMSSHAKRTRSFKLSISRINFSRSVGTVIGPSHLLVENIRRGECSAAITVTIRRERNEGAQQGGDADNPKHCSDTVAAVQG